MSLPKSFTTVTTLSKTLALILFITLPFLGFYLGIQYEKRVGLQSAVLTPPAKLPTTAQPTPVSSFTPPAGCHFEIDPNSPCKPCPADQPACRQLNCAPNQILVCQSGTPNPTCRPRPTCLDATPRCMIPETSDMCPRSTPSAGLKACPMLAFKNSEGKTCTYSGPNCDLTCK